MRKDGWYWVKRDMWDGKVEYTPAYWRNEYKAWYSAEFRGVPDSEFVVGPPLVAPDDSEFK